MAPSDAAEKNRNKAAQLQSLAFKIAPKCFGKFTSCMTLDAHKLVRSDPFRTTHTNFDNCCQRYIATCRNFFLYQCTSTFSALNYCGRIFFRSLSYLYEVGRTNFSADFLDFSQFLTLISRQLWRHLAKKCEICSSSERAVYSEKGL